MKIAHHVDDATLMSYAAGSLPEALGAVVAAHLSVCDKCRRELAGMETIGVALMGELPEAPLAKSQPCAMTPAKGEAAPPTASTTGVQGLPAQLSRLFDGDLSSIRWKRLGLGVWHVPIPLSEGAKGDLRLIRIAPGQAMPAHGHGGTELTLVLSGSYSDEVGHFGKGDIADLDEEVEHSPVSDPKTGCVCLIAFEAKARFKGLLARMVQPLIGM